MKQHPRSGNLSLLHVRVPAPVAQALRREAGRREVSVSLCAASILAQGLGLELAAPAAEPGPVAEPAPAAEGADPAPFYRCSRCGARYARWVPRCDGSDGCGGRHTLRKWGGYPPGPLP